MKHKITTILPVILFIATAHLSFAGSATWSTRPTSTDWNTATNWMPNTVPNTAADIATFATSSRTSVSLSQPVTVDSIVFSPGARPFSINTLPIDNLTISGAGVINNSGVTQNFIANFDPVGFLSQLGISFTNSATAGTNVTYSMIGGVGGFTGTGGRAFFEDNSSADHADFQVYATDGNSESLSNGLLEFDDSSTAGNATITLHNRPVQGNPFPFRADLEVTTGATLGDATVTNNGEIFFIGGNAGNSVITTDGVAYVQFNASPTGNASAGSATFINNPGRLFSNDFNFFMSGASADQAVIMNNGGTAAGQLGAAAQLTGLAPNLADAGNSTLITNGGTNGGGGGLMEFAQGSSGGTARIEVFGNGNLDISSHIEPGITTGSLEGDGLVFLGARNLTLGSSELSTEFSGVIQDGGVSGGVGGSLTKIGSGTLTLSGANLYTGGTTVSAGILVISNTSGSGMGTGAVAVNGGTLGGSGTMSGAVTVNSGAFLAPAADTKKQSTLTTLSALTFNSGATYSYTFKAKGNKARADSVVANGVTINSGAGFNFSGQAQGTLRSGLVFTVLKNTSATPIAGTFSNLPDGAILTVNGNNFQASYSGGDGNDLTLTIVP